MRFATPTVLRACFGCAALLGGGLLGCSQPPDSSSPAAVVEEVPPAATSESAEVAAERARRIAGAAFWNQPNVVSELGLGEAERARLNDLVPEILAALRGANQGHRRATAAWAEAARSGDPAALTARARDLVAAAEAVARVQAETKTKMLAALEPTSARRLAERYPRFLAAPWTRANRLVDTSDLGKWLESPFPPKSPG